MNTAAEKKSCTCPVGGCALRRGRQPDGECAMERTQRAVAGAGPARPLLTPAQLMALRRVSDGYRNGTPVFAPSTLQGTRGVLGLSYAIRRQLEGLGLIEQYDHAAEMRATSPNVAVPPFLYFRPTAAGRDVVMAFVPVMPATTTPAAPVSAAQDRPAPLAAIITHHLRNLILDLGHEDQFENGTRMTDLAPVGTVATPFVAEGENVYGLRIALQDSNGRSRVFMVVVKEVE